MTAQKEPTWWKIFVWICVYYFDCTKFGLLILRKIIKMVATRCHILRLKCTKFDFQIAFCAESYYAVVVPVVILVLNII